MTAPSKARRGGNTATAGRRGSSARPAAGKAAINPTEQSTKDSSAVTGSRPTAGDPRAAAEKTARHSSTRVTLPLLGTVELPARDELAFLGGVGALAIAGAIEWPVAVLLGAGHALAASRRNRAVREFGEALEEA